MSNDRPPPPAKTKAPRIGLPILPPRAAWIELVVLFGLILGIDRMLPGIDASNIQPHPFWLPVLVLSLQYGTISGLLAACSAIGLLAAIYGFAEQDIGENLFVYLSRAWSQPVLWVGAAVVLGQFRMRQIEAKQDLVAAVEQLTSQRNSLADYSEGLRSRCDALERREAGRTFPDAVKSLTTLGVACATPPGDLGVLLARILADVLPGAGARIRLLQDGAVIDAASSGPQAAGLGGPSSARRLERLERLVISQMKEHCVLDRDVGDSLTGIGLVAVPVPGASGPIGMLILTHLAPHQLGEETVAIARLVATALAPAAQRTLDPLNGPPDTTPEIGEPQTIGGRSRFGHTSWTTSVNPTGTGEKPARSQRSTIKA